MTVIFLTICVSLSDTGTWGRISATEAHNRCFLASGSVGRRVLYRCIASFLLSAKSRYLSQSAGSSNFSTTDSGDRPGFTLCLSPHLAPQEVASVHDSGPVDDPDDNVLCGHFNNNDEDRPRSAAAVISNRL